MPQNDHKNKPNSDLSKIIVLPRGFDFLVGVRRITVRLIQVQMFGSYRVCCHTCMLSLSHLSRFYQGLIF